jgi:DNA adenine methylase
MQPLIKYTGSKSPFLKEIRTLLPADYNKVFIPFIGGGSLMSLFEGKELYISDIVEPLMQVYKLAKTEPDLLKTSYFEHWTNFGISQKYYYASRTVFNSLKNVPNSLMAAQIFFFIMRVCFNGVVRFNSKGEFNTSLHVTRRGMQPDTLNKIIDFWSARLQTVEIALEDYKETFKLGSAGDLFVLDPPYYHTKGQYQFEKFDYDELFRQIVFLSQRGAKVLMFFDENVPSEVEKLLLYSGFEKSATAKQHSSLGALNKTGKQSGNTVYRNYK